MSDPIVSAPWWAQYAGGAVIALIGSGALLSESIRKIRSGFGRAETRKLNAEAVVSEATAANLAANRTVDYERMLNERTFKNMDILIEQVKHLSELADAQSESLRAQSQKMDHMEREIISLRQALDARTLELRAVKSYTPPVCCACAFFDGERCATKDLSCKLTATDDQSELPLILHDN